MRAIFFHADRFGFLVESPSERLGGVAPEETEEKSLDVEECLVVLFHIEEQDDEGQVRRLCKDIRRIAKKVGATRLVVAAFGHLSDSYAPPSAAMEISREVVGICQEWSEFETYTSPFGQNKTLVLHSKGHPDAIKYRGY